MSDYTKTVDFAAKDALASGNASKAVKGTELDTEFNNIATAVATKYDANDRGVANGLASLDASTLVPAAQLPAATETAVGALETATAAEASARTATDKILVPSVFDDAQDAWAGENAGMVLDIQALADPNADRLLGWDDSVGAVVGLEVTTGLAFTSSSTLQLQHLALEALSDPNDDRIFFWDDSAGASAWLDIGDGLDITATTISLASSTAGTGLAYSSGILNLDISGLTALSGSAVAGTDGYLVDDAGTMKRIAHQSAGYPVFTGSAAKTFADSDMNAIHELTGGTDRAFTLNTGVGEQGNVIILVQKSTGSIQINGTATVTAAIGQFTRVAGSVAQLICVGTDDWIMTGDTASS